MWTPVGSLIFRDRFVVALVQQPQFANRSEELESSALLLRCLATTDSKPVLDPRMTELASQLTIGILNELD
jgi:hypothetical protein